MGPATRYRMQVLSALRGEPDGRTLYSRWIRVTLQPPYILFFALI